MAEKPITFHFQHPTFRLRKRHAIRAWLEAATATEGQAVASLRYLFCTDAFMLEHNQQFLQHDYFTDILTFPDFASGGLAGDILISIDRVKDNALHLGTTFTQELHRVIAHGALHLCGINDKNAKEQRIMRAKEETWLGLRAQHAL